MKSLKADNQEKAVLGCCMIDQGLVPQVLSALDPQDFRVPWHGALLRLIEQRTSAGLACDVVALPEAVARLNERCGTISEVMSLPDIVPSTAALAAYVVDVKSASTLRQLQHLGDLLREEAESGKGVDEVMERATAELSRIASRAESAAGPMMISDVAAQCMARYTQQRTGDESVLPIPTGIGRLDDQIGGGIRRSELTVIAARPAMGKTSLGMQILDSAVSEGLSALTFSAEMTGVKLVDRLLAYWAGIPAARLRQPHLLTIGELQSLDRQAQEMDQCLLAVDDRTRPTLAQIKAASQRHQIRHGLDVILLDYFTILGIPQAGDRRQALDTMVVGLMELAKDLGIAVVLLAQLNREVSKRASEAARPKMSDIKDCGAVEESAHLILMPYRPHEDGKSDDPSEAEIIIAKQRAGPSGEVPVYWDGTFMRFEETDDKFGIGAAK
jgi:replicative DNA helicase